MRKSQLPPNFVKHTSKNPLQRLLIRNFYRSLTAVIEPLKPKTVLDVGCGEGFSLQKLSEKHIGQKLEGVDYSEEAIALGKKLFPHLSLRRGTIYHLPYKDRSFELVLSIEVLEHLKHPQKGLNELKRVAQRYIILSVPNEPFFMISNVLRGKNITRFGNDPEHIQHWTIFSFRTFLKRNAITIKKTLLPFPWIMVLGEINTSI